MQTYAQTTKLYMDLSSMQVKKLKINAKYCISPSLKTSYGWPGATKLEQLLSEYFQEHPIYSAFPLI